MLSSNSSSCNQNPNYSLFSENDINSFTSSKSDPNNTFTFFPFPNSPNFDYDDVYLHLLDHLDLDVVAAHYNNAGGKTAPPPRSDCIDRRNPSSDAAAAAESHRRPSAGRSMKKDRHSKINTARGPRDRRMRLSLDIARKFFDLQDMLRFDKASRTVDWLLRNSAAAIRELARGRDGAVEGSSLILTESNCTSEDCGEAATSSSATEVKTTAAVATAAANRRGKRGRGVIKEKRARVGKESRNKARDRARERTSQKKRLMRENVNGTVSDAAGTTTIAAGTTHNNFSLIYDDDDDDAALSLRSADEARLLCQFSFHETNNQFFNQGEQIAEINDQFNDKTWEAYNGFNLSK